MSIPFLLFKELESEQLSFAQEKSSQELDGIGIVVRW